jgi:hypothetical protein
LSETLRSSALPRARSPEGLFADGLADISFAALRRVTRAFAGAVFGGARGARDALGVAVAEVGITRSVVEANAGRSTKMQSGRCCFDFRAQSRRAVLMREGRRKQIEASWQVAPWRGTNVRGRRTMHGTWSGCMQRGYAQRRDRFGR